MLRHLQRKIRQLNMNCFLITGCIFFLLTIVLKYVSLDCNMDDVNESGDIRGEYCRNHYYQALNLSASGRKNCSKIILGDWNEVRNTLGVDNLIVKNKKVIATDTEYLEVTKDCKEFKKLKKYVMISLSEEERNYPIAYSMVVHDNIEMFKRLLRSIYTSQNIYCVHVDMKSQNTFHKAVRAIAACFHNVFVASKLESVVYASWFRVQADLNCMENLLKSNVGWKYLINTCGADFPLKTNAEIVNALQSLTGKNSMESEIPPPYKKRRWQYHHEIKDYVVQTDIKKKPPPLNISIFSGSAYIVVTRGFVKSLFEKSIAKELIDWAKDIYSPDEYLWATLQRLPGMPGSLPTHIKYDTSDINALARLVKWQSLEGDTEHGALYTACTGKNRRQVCVYGTGDLHWMLQQHHLFANKFDPIVDDHAIQCLEEYLRYKYFYGNIM
ncbi:beta-1,3-galactosyl-O-glycosyl-glycoprotein beta-1,6-N-acetylglucosaminyltransferase 3-like [Mixophyes fleayi]|uniref:beta-1,3-galactosyl-O-glycosyl-glycoprotein beta-1,6-N-acetylglucosaminyltransferase 3-like n=1 Tax=Mixophyes fleayi TaxID=3061075 RepID=UPI003F4DE03F